MDLNQIIHFLVVAEETRSLDDLTKELEKLVEGYGFDFYSLVKKPKPDENSAEPFLMGRWPKRWSDIYQTKKYALIDPVIRYLARAQVPFRWSDALAAFKVDPHRKRMGRMMDDAAQHGLQDGYTFPVHGKTGLLGFLSVGGRSVELSPVEISLFDAAAKKAFWRYLELTGQAEEFLLKAAVEVRMTRREMEILHYLADGMTSNEISKTLSISSHTVDWYMNGVQDKLNAKNRQHVVAYAFRLGLIT